MENLPEFIHLHTRIRNKVAVIIEVRQTKFDMKIQGFTMLRLLFGKVASCKLGLEATCHF